LVVAAAAGDAAGEGDGDGDAAALTAGEAAGAVVGAAGGFVAGALVGDAGALGWQPTIRTAASNTDAGVVSDRDESMRVLPLLNLNSPNPAL
jgi:hypothetical protein